MEDAIFDPLARGRTLLYYDQRGGAGYPYAGDNPSDSHLLTLTADRHVQDLEVIRRHFGLRRMTIVGHSWGTGLAALYTHTYPDRVNRLLLVGPMPVRRKPHFEQFVSNLHREPPIGSLDLPGLAEHLEGADSLSHGENVRVEPYWFNASCTSRDGDSRNTQVANETGWRSLGDWDWRPMLSTLEVPTLVVFGTSDNVPAASTEEWVESLPNARLLTFPGVGHFPHYEWPKQFYEAAESFLRGEWPPGARVRYRPRGGS
ncbi:MAG: alpha/beta fold hydrolase [Gemmatimonadetes bacterium]|nr:alpha/beta fold hydrolase [Gemmatimonadota bacterium]